MEGTLYSTASRFILDFIDSQKLSISESRYYSYKRKAIFAEMQETSIFALPMPNSVQKNQNNYSLKLQEKNNVLLNITLLLVRIKVK